MSNRQSPKLCKLGKRTQVGTELTCLIQENVWHSGDDISPLPDGISKPHPFQALQTVVQPPQPYTVAVLDEGSTLQETNWDDEALSLPAAAKCSVKHFTIPQWKLAARSTAAQLLETHKRQSSQQPLRQNASCSYSYMVVFLLEERLNSRKTAKITISFLYPPRRFLL